jgi:hypothetical protein
MGLQKDIKGHIMAMYGRYSANVIDEIAKEFDPEQFPVEFSERCIDFLSIALGKDAAKEKMREYFKYIK